ncbi:MEGF8 protein, partial [Trogon melanurus]|nr:MEGF8 protein [Trogon melanurus]
WGPHPHPGVPTLTPQIPTWVSEGPSEDEAVCVNCGNNSVGERCEGCRPGFFLLDGVCTRYRGVPRA